MLETSLEADRQALTAKLQRLSHAWAKGDAEAFAAEFSEEALYVAFDGTVMNGRAAIAEGHRPLFTHYLRGSTLYTEQVEIRFASADVAIVYGRGAVLRRSQHVPSKRRMSVNTTVAVRCDAEWSFVAFQNTRYRPFASTLLGRLLAAISVGSRDVGKPRQ